MADIGTALDAEVIHLSSFVLSLILILTLVLTRRGCKQGHDDDGQRQIKLLHISNF